MVFTPTKKYVLTESLGDDPWLAKDTIIICVSTGPVNFFAHPAASLAGIGKFTLDNEDSLITISDYYSRFNYHRECDHKSIRFMSGVDDIRISITSHKRSSNGVSVYYKYCITSNEHIKVIGDGYSSTGDLPVFEDMIKLYKNN